MKDNGRLTVSLLMLAIFLFFVVQALAFAPQARAMPLLIGVPAILLCLMQVVLDLKGRGPAAVKAMLLLPQERPVILWLLAFLAGNIAFGFAYGAPPLVAAYLYFAARERPIVAIAGGVFSIVVLSFVFERVLQVQLFEGLVTGLLF